MAVIKAPYINYTELDSNPLATGEGSEIPIFIGTSTNTVSAITRDNIKLCRNITQVKDAIGENSGELYNKVRDFYKENSLRILNGELDVASPYVYVFDLGSNGSVADFKKAVHESKVKRESTCVAFTNYATTSSLEWEESTLTTPKKVTETITATGEVVSEPTETQITKEYELVNNEDVAFSPLYLATLSDEYRAVIQTALSGNKITPNYKTAFESAYSSDATNLQITLMTAVANELKEETKTGMLRIGYFGVESQRTNETFDAYLDRIKNITTSISSPRIALIEAEDFGISIARICSTPYYIEPGYDAYESVETTQYKRFKERTPEERDALFNAGLIFNEYDYTLPEITPRMCLGVSTAWGVMGTDYDNRVNDALLHARRNVDHQIRELFKVIAPQLKRNETSVNLRQLNTELNLCLQSEVDLGRLQEYSIDIEEVSFNPYCLKISGRITPVNSTLAIEFENYVGAPYAIATDYI